MFTDQAGWQPSFTKPFVITISYVRPNTCSPNISINDLSLKFKIGEDLLDSWYVKSYNIMTDDCASILYALDRILDRTKRRIISLKLMSFSIMNHDTVDLSQFLKESVTLNIEY